MAKEQSQIRERQRTNLKEPRRYKVIIYNDDFSTMEFVVMILVQVFLKSEEEAQALKSGSRRTMPKAADSSEDSMASL
jgi:ATP-dependent Clp protease adaptor protein ClpS